MFSRLALLFALAVFPFAHAIAFPTPLPTNTQHATSEPPQPTVGLRLKPRAADESTYSSLLTISNLCGWDSSEIYDTLGTNAITCPPDNSCVFHKSNTAFPGMAGCCTNRDCAFATACYDQAAINSEPSLTSTHEAFALFCTKEPNTLCVTYTWPGLYVNAKCASFELTQTGHLEALWSDSALDAWEVTQKLTTVDEKTLTYCSDSSSKRWQSNQKSSSSSSTSSTSVPATTSATPSATGTPSPSIAPGSDNPDTSGSDTSSSSTSPGAIAGGIVGGVCGGAAIAGTLVFLLLRRKKKAQHETHSPGETYASEYHAVPQNQSSHHSSWQMQHVTQPEAAYKPELPDSSSPGAIPKPSPQNPQEPPAELPDAVHR